MDMPEGFECQCPPGYEGTRCEIDIDYCASDPCLNGATCLDLVEGYECQCPPGWEGTNCEFGMYLKYHKSYILGYLDTDNQLMYIISNCFYLAVHIYFCKYAV